MEIPGENLISDKVLGRYHSPSGCSDSWRCRRERLACRRGRRRCGTRSRCRSWAGLGGSLEGRGRGARSRAPSRPPNPGPGMLRSMLVFNQFYVRILMMVFTQLQEGRRERQRIQSKDCCISELHTDQIKVDNIFLLMLVFISIFANLFSAYHDSR